MPDLTEHLLVLHLDLSMGKQTRLSAFRPEGISDEDHCRRSPIGARLGYLPVPGTGSSTRRI